MAASAFEALEMKNQFSDLFGDSSKFGGSSKSVDGKSNAIVGGLSWVSSWSAAINQNGTVASR
jgi:hypothetical protein